MQRKSRIFCLFLAGVTALLVLPRQIAALTGVLPAAQADQAVQTATVNPSTPVERVLLLLKPSAAQDSALDTLLANLQTVGSAQYHQWLTPAAFAQNYSLNAASTQQVVQWLKSQNFTVAPLPAGGGWIEFTGTAAQFQSAFGTEISTLKGSTQFVATNIAIPDAIAPYTLGLASLDGVLARPAIAHVSTVSLANTVGLLTPASIASRYSLAAQQGTDGTGVTIAIPSRSNLAVEQVASFRSNFGLVANAVQLHLAGNDPGTASTADQQEALLDATWAGVAAPKATVLVVPAATTAATDGLDLSFAAIVDQHLADVVSLSYLSCEEELSATHRAFYRALYRQAAAEGMTILAAAGDSGASACSVAGSASTGYSVNALAATPWNIAVGGTALLTNNSESAWQASSISSNNAGGGGFSHYYATPSWQAALGVPLSDPATTASHHRYLPDLSLAATDLAGGYTFCDAGCTDGILNHATGTSGATALFAGIFAQTIQKYGAQGAAAPVLYELSRVAGVYNDITTGTAKTFCTTGTTGCGADGLLGYSASTGFDLATGLGSVNAQGFISNYGIITPLGSTAATVTFNTTAQSIYYNQPFVVSVTVSATSGSGATPTGGITIYDQTVGSVVAGGALNSSGNASITLLGGSIATGSHSLVAMYAGDGTYSSGQSSPLQIVVTLVPTVTTATIGTTSIVYGNTIAAVATVVPTASITQVPTGTVTFKIDGTSAGSAAVVSSGTTYTASMSLQAQTVGSHTLVATYAGDTNYATSSSASTNLVVGKATSVTTLTSTPTVLATGTPTIFTATITVPTTSSVTSPVFTGTVQFLDGTTLLGTAVTVSGNTASTTALTLAAGSTHSITAVYSGDTNWLTSTSTALTTSTTATLLSTTTVLTVNATTLNSSSILTLTATVTPNTFSNSTVNPTGKVIFYDGTKPVGSVTMAASTLFDSVAVLNLSSLTPGPHSYTAVYLGDTAYATSTSNVVTVQVQDFTISAGVLSVNVARGGTGSVVYTITGYGGYNNAIEITCSAPSDTYITCYFTPNVLDGSGVTTLTIVTGGASTGDRSIPQSRRTTGGIALATLLGLFAIPAFRRRRKLLNFAASLLLLLGFISMTSGCTSSPILANNNVGQTPLGVTTLTITAAAVVNNTTISHRVYLPVNVQ